MGSRAGRGRALGCHGRTVSGSACFNPRGSERIGDSPPRLGGGDRSGPDAWNVTAKAGAQAVLGGRRRDRHQKRLEEILVATRDAREPCRVKEPLE